MTMETTPSVDEASIAVEAVKPGAFSIYHADWFLDAATDGQWAEARVFESGVLVGRMPYVLRKCAGFTISNMPSLIRTLGPEIAPLAGKEATVQRRRIEIAHALIEQLPGVADFQQVFDPRIADAVAFMTRGFDVNVAYAFWMERGGNEKEVFDNMRSKSRRDVGRAAKHFSVAPVDVAAFCRFHDANLGGAQNFHGSERMQRLLEAVVAHGAGSLISARTPQGEVAATLAVIWDGAAAHNYIGARRPDASAASALLLWEAMRMSFSKDLAFDFDGVVSPTMFEFLSGFGGKFVQRLRVRRSTIAFRGARAAAAILGRKDYFDN